MDRKVYLGLMQRYSVGEGDAKVGYKGGEYWPVRYVLWYKDGKARHTAVLSDGRNLVDVPLEKVDEV